MDIPHPIEGKLHINPRFELKSNDVMTEATVIPRRQDKIIAAIVRQDPRLILQHAVTLNEEERQNFKSRSGTKRLDRITDRDFETALSLTPISIKDPPDEANLRRNFGEFSGDETEKRRMRRVIAKVTKGSLDSQEQVEPQDLYDFVYKHCRTAIAYERKIPQLLEAINKRSLGTDNYLQALDNVGEALYGSQWLYLQQGRLAEAEARQEMKDGNKLFRQPRLIEQPEISPTLAKNPDAVLQPNTEIQDYLERQDRSYLEQLQTLNAEIGSPMHQDTKAAICIPVAGTQEAANIYKTLSGYADQTLGSNSYEIILLVNTPERFRESKAGDLATTFSEIERVKQDFPDLAIRVADVTIPDDQVNIWNLRKIATDLGVLRANEAGIQNDVLLLSNDADNQGISPDYLKSYVDYFSRHPEKDGAVGNLQYDPQAFIRFPEMAVATEFATRLDQQGFKNGNVMLFGSNSAIKASTYCAIGGYPSTEVQGMDGEQGWTGHTIRRLRQQKGTLGFVEDALLTTASRRGVLQYLRDPNKAVEFGDVKAEELMRSLDVNSYPVFDWSDTAAATQMQYAIAKRIDSYIKSYERGEHLGKNSWFYRTNLEAIGIQYRVEGDPKDLESRIVITDMRGFVDRQKRMQHAIRSGKTNMAKVFQAAA